MSDIANDFLDENDAARNMNNRELAKQMLAVIAARPLTALEGFVIMEAVERLLPAELIETNKRKN